MKSIVIYTDGACSYNPGPGGWGAILIYKDQRKELSGFQELTTNNQMELLSAINSLKMLKEPCEVNLYSDSAYLVNGFTQGWVEKWQQNGFRNSKKKEVENIDLWKQLINLNDYHKITWNKVKGHADNALNNRCDELARMEIDKFLNGNK
ncbi:MAG: ribonuclease HI [Clostridia bacterium]|nr:ribonuclease HI [Clostridia bacterium]